MKILTRGNSESCVILGIITDDIADTLIGGRNKIKEFVKASRGIVKYTANTEIDVEEVKDWTKQSRKLEKVHSAYKINISNECITCEFIVAENIEDIKSEMKVSSKSISVIVLNVEVKMNRLVDILGKSVKLNSVIQQIIKQEKCDGIQDIEYQIEQGL